MSGDLTMAFIN